MDEKSCKATVVFQQEALVHMVVRPLFEICIFVPFGGDTESMASAFEATEAESGVQHCHASRFIRANRHAVLTPEREIHLDADYRYRIQGDNLWVWELDFDHPPRGILGSYPPGIEPAKERKKYNAMFQNAVWRILFNGKINEFITKYHH